MRGACMCVYVHGWVSPAIPPSVLPPLSLPPPTNPPIHIHLHTHVYTYVQVDGASHFFANLELEASSSSASSSSSPAEGDSNHHQQQEGGRGKAPRGQTALKRRCVLCAGKKGATNHHQPKSTHPLTSRPNKTNPLHRILSALVQRGMFGGAVIVTTDEWAAAAKDGEGGKRALLSGKLAAVWEGTAAAAGATVVAKAGATK